MMTRKKRVLILTPFFSPNLGGVETHIDDLCRYLTEHNFFVYVLTYQPLTTKAKGASCEKRENIEIDRVNWWGFDLFHKLEPYPLVEFLYLFPRLFWATAVFMYKRHREIDAIHAHGFIAAMITRLVTMIYPKTTTMSTHAIYGLKNRWLMSIIARWALNGFTTVMPLAEESKKDLLSTGVKPELLQVYIQWVDQKIFRPRSKSFCRQKLGIMGDFVVLFVGRLIEKKGIFVLAEVAKRMREISFVFVGDGPMLETLKAEVRELNNVYVVGNKSQKEVTFYYGAADVLVVPSQYKEGFARVVLEALFSGRPVIAAKNGCLPEMINSKVGILVKPTKVKISEAISIFYTNKNLLRKMGSTARLYAKKHFSENNAAEIAATYFKEK